MAHPGNLWVTSSRIPAKLRTEERVYRAAQQDLRTGRNAPSHCPAALRLIEQGKKTTTTMPQMIQSVAIAEAVTAQNKLATKRTVFRLSSDSRQNPPCQRLAKVEDSSRPKLTHEFLERGIFYKVSGL
jgi:hypothetical protein